MRIENDVLAVLKPKDSEDELCFGLSAKEVKCHCSDPSCDHTIICHPLIKAYEELRTVWAKPIYINSGYRCQKHNEEVGGVAGSSHVKGLALDLSVGGMHDLDRQRFINLCKTIFSFVKEYPTWIHVQVNV